MSLDYPAVAHADVVVIAHDLFDGERRVELDEAEATARELLLVGDDHNIGDVSEVLERLSEVGFGDVFWQSADEDLLGDQAAVVAFVVAEHLFGLGLLALEPAARELVVFAQG